MWVAVWGCLYKRSTAAGEIVPAQLQLDVGMSETNLGVVA